MTGSPPGILESYTRIFVEAGGLDGAVAFYKRLLDGEETLRFADPKTALELAAVSAPRLSVLIVAGAPENRRAFEATRLTIKVEALEPVVAALHAAGAQQLEPIRATPVGRKTRFHHPDGLVVEYVDRAVKD